MEKTQVPAEPEKPQGGFAKWLGRIVGGVLVATALLLGVLYFVGGTDNPSEVPVPPSNGSKFNF